MYKLWKSFPPCPHYQHIFLTMKIPFILAVLLLSTYPTVGKYVQHYPNHLDLTSNVRPGKLLLKTYSPFFNPTISFTVQRMRPLIVPSLTTETQALKNKILLLSWAASMTMTLENEGHENNSDLKDLFWKVLYDVFEVEIGQQRTSKSVQQLNLLRYLSRSRRQVVE